MGTSTEVESRKTFKDFSNLGLTEERMLQLLNEYLQREAMLKLRRKLSKLEYIHPGNTVELSFPLDDPRSSSTVESLLCKPWLYEGQHGVVSKMGQTKDLCFVSFEGQVEVPVSVCYLRKLAV